MGLASQRGEEVLCFLVTHQTSTHTHTVREDTRQLCMKIDLRDYNKHFPFMQSTGISTVSTSCFLWVWLKYRKLRGNPPLLQGYPGPPHRPARTSPHKSFNSHMESRTLLWMSLKAFNTF
jgi:hypothetical protein